MPQKILLNKSKPTFQYDKSILENISWSYTDFRTHRDVKKILQDKNPYTITVLIENLKWEYRNKKEYVRKTKIPIISKYQELLYQLFFKNYGDIKGNKIYRQWLTKYRPVWLKDRKYEFIDDYIIKQELEPRYKNQILSRFKNKNQLYKQRFRIDRERYYCLPKPLNWIDWRNPYDNIFVWEENGQKVARRGGSGSSGGRATNSIFIFGILAINRINPVSSYLFLYSEDNKLLFIKKFASLCVPLYDLGSNYYLDDHRAENLKENGQFLRWNSFDKIKEIAIGSYKQIEKYNRSEI
jgi:hypothetical protein